MKLHAEVADRKYAVNIQDGRRVFAEIDGRHYEVEVRESGPFGYSFISQGRVWDCRLEGPPESAHKIEVMVGTTGYVVTIVDPKRLRSATRTTVHGSDAARIVASMPGKVVRVLTEVGATVEAGDGIIVVEAMKMQNEMKSPKAGIVVALNTQTGATVNGGDVLAVIE